MIILLIFIAYAFIIQKKIKIYQKINILKIWKIFFHITSNLNKI